MIKAPEWRLNLDQGGIGVAPTLLKAPEVLLQRHLRRLDLVWSDTYDALIKGERHPGRPDQASATPGAP
jgi:hypothetical protein